MHVYFDILQTANTLVFLLAKLAMNPEKQTKLYEEIQRVVGDSEVLTKEHIAKMSYLKACLRESHRYSQTEWNLEMYFIYINVLINFYFGHYGNGMF